MPIENILKVLLKVKVFIFIFKNLKVFVLFFIKMKITFHLKENNQL